MWAGIAQSVQHLATGWTDRGSNPGGGDILPTPPHLPGAHPTFCTMGTGLFTGVKRLGRGVDHPPQSSVEVKERVELYFYSSSDVSWPVLRYTANYIVTVLENFVHTF